MQLRGSLGRRAGKRATPAKWPAALCLVAWAFLLFSPAAGAGEPGAARPGPGDKCPVCGMFVAKYPEFVAGAVFRDGSRAWFDGVKDLMKFYFRPGAYQPGRKTEDIAGVVVTDYYTLKQIDGRAAWYVVGSDVLGPMGRELIPLAEEQAAREFLRDHRGQRVLTFSEITPALLATLD